MRIRMILAVIVAAMWGSPRIAEAGTVHRIKFTSAPVVHVWSNGAAAGSGSSVQLVTGAVSIEQPFHTGILEPIPASASSVSGLFDLSIASNAGFVIEASPVNNTQVTGPIRVTVMAVGQNAALSAPLGAQLQTRASDLDTSRVIFASAARTAINPGPVESQAVTLRVESSVPLTIAVTALSPEDR